MPSHLVIAFSYRFVHGTMAMACVSHTGASVSFSINLAVPAIPVSATSISDGDALWRTAAPDLDNYIYVMSHAIDRDSTPATLQRIVVIDRLPSHTFSILVSLWHKTCTLRYRDSPLGSSSQRSYK